MPALFGVPASAYLFWIALWGSITLITLLVIRKEARTMATVPAHYPTCEEACSRAGNDDSSCAEWCQDAELNDVWNAMSDAHMDWDYHSELMREEDDEHKRRAIAARMNRITAEIDALGCTYESLKGARS